LECGHNQHVRHDPPYVERPWVITEHGRRSRLGQELNCVRCDEDRYATTRLGGSDMALVSFGDDRALAIRDHILPLLREYGALQVQRDTEADGWNYPPVRKLRRHRPHRKPMAANNPKTEESIADEPEPGGTGPFGSMNRCRKVAWEDHAAPERRQEVIAQREHWKARALAGGASGGRTQSACRRSGSLQRAAVWSRGNCIRISAMAVSLRN
jgi:hypothetical protein